jgi:hypothetical protein
MGEIGTSGGLARMRRKQRGGHMLNKEEILELKRLHFLFDHNDTEGGYSTDDVLRLDELARRSTVKDREKVCLACVHSI